MRSCLVLCILLSCLLWIGTDAACGSQLTSTVDVDITSPNIIKKLWVNSLYPFTISQGDAFRIQYQGTDEGQAEWITSSADVTMTITMKGAQVPQTGLNPPATKTVISSSNKLAPVAQLAAALFGLVICKYTTKGGVLALLVSLCLTSLNIVQTADGDSACQNVAVQITIPSGKVQTICDATNGTCVCGPDYSGPNCNYYKAKCIPTAQQIQNRFNFPDVFNPPVIPLPEPGESFCDTNFGTEIWRVSNREQPTQPDEAYFAGPVEQNIDQRVHILGSVGFSPDLKYVVAQNAAGSAFLYEVNIDEYNVPHIDPKKRVLFSLARDEIGFASFLLADLGRGAWMTDTKFAFLTYDQVFAIDVTGNKTAIGGFVAKHIGNLTQFLVNDYYPDRLTDISRCSSARIRPDGSLRMMCDVGYGAGTLKQPNAAQVDSHYPNATCVNAAWDPNGSSARIGYIIFDILSATPADPQTNIRMQAKFINGVDSDDWYCWQSTRQWSSQLGDYRTWVIYNGFNNGYKPLIDRSGEWIINGAIDKPETAYWDVGLQPAFKVKFRPISEGGGIERSVVHDFEGHAGYGWGQAMMQCGAPGDCEGWCIGYLNFTDIPDDDPGVYLPTSAIGPRFNEDPFIYSNGLYGTYHHATPTNQGEAVMQSGCDVSIHNCSLSPRGSEVMRVIPDKNGGGTIERILSTRDASHTQYAVITAPCNDDDGPCWVLFQSSWGASRATPGNVVTSDIFIARFR